MALRRKIGLTLGLMLLGLLGLIAINSGLGVDRDETFTDLHRPEIVGNDRSLTP